jgi:gamma-glutamylcyclotransferase (GGCT)/AIG2-like uncharacterized protein YtfP
VSARARARACVTLERENEMADYLFVYGTLLPGRGPAALRPVLARLRDVGPGTTCGRLYHLGRYPGCKLIDGDEVIAGRVLELPDDPEVLRVLDAYEGYDPAGEATSLFIRRRCQVRVTTDDGRTIDCWVYEYNRDLGKATHIPGGSYADWQRRDPGPWD